MSMLDVCFMIGPLGAPVMTTLAMTVLVVRHRRRAVRLGAPLAVLVALSWVGYWYLWGKAFEYADAFKPVPPPVDTARTTLAVICALASVALVTAAATTFGFAPRTDVRRDAARP
ncbi:hypothetical protein [Actinopolymorpha sp. B9G3]|uniref:hypothetical protein n=1 Tax=Actinopolymorpha sp. B9G3 TaxID=3158970 RepID=UPI0032D8FD2C